MPEQIASFDGDLVLTTNAEVTKSNKIPILCEDILDFDPTVIRSLIMQKLGYIPSSELLIGIDPGKRIGLSIFYYGKEIERSLYTSIDDLVFHLVRIFVELHPKKRIVRIGNGDMNLAKKITAVLNLNFCSDFEIEFVDERGTSVKIKNFNQRGKRDMLSAKFISHREGNRQLILPLSRTG